jgi:hypothetical protein
MRILAHASNLPFVRTDDACPPKRVTIRDALARHSLSKFPCLVLAEDVVG